MVTTLRSYPNHHEIPLHFHTSSKKNEIKHKICNIARNIFSYLQRNQHAIRAGLWSYLFIEGGIAASALITAEVVYDLDSCQNMICQQWNNSIENRNKFSSSIEFRCNPTSPNYHPFSFLDKCMNELCDYMAAIGKDLIGCRHFFNNSDTDSHEEAQAIPSQLWKALCPKVHLRHHHPMKELTVINSCIHNICNYYAQFKTEATKIIINFCENKNLDRLNDLVDRMGKIVHELEKKAEQEDGWTRTNTIASLVTSLLSIIGAGFAIGITIVTYKVQVKTANVRPILLNLRNMFPPIIEAVAALREENEANTVEESQQIDAMNTFISEAQNLVCDLSEVITHSGSYEEMGEEAFETLKSGVELGLSETGIAIVGTGLPVDKIGAAKTGISLGKSILGGISIIEKNVMGTVKPNTEMDLNTAGGMSITPGESIIGGSTVNLLSLPRSMLKSIYTHQHTFFISNTTYYQWEKTLREYVNDFMYGPFDDLNLTQVQGDRLKNSLATWNDSFCFYQHQNYLFCRHPLERHINDSAILIPEHHTKLIADKNVPGICYILLSELWCNWDKIFNLFFNLKHVRPAHESCLWDKFSLNVDKSDSYTITAMGNCYNQTAIIKI